MSAAKIYARYAVQWLELFDGFKEFPTKVHVIHCKDEKQAKALRCEFYKAREAFLDEASMRDEYQEVLNSKEVLVRGNDVVFEFKDNNWAAKLIKDSLHPTEDKEGEG